LEYTEKYELELSARTATKLVRKTRKLWTCCVNIENAHIATPDALDLLDQMLKIDRETRTSAKKTLRHPFFASLQD
jgi:casein kinase II subunit alpha